MRSEERRNLTLRNFSFSKAMNCVVALLGVAAALPLARGQGGGWGITTEVALRNSIATNANLQLVSSIDLASEIEIVNKTGLVIDGMGHTLDGQRAVRCFNILESEVTVKDLVIANGVLASSSGAGIYIGNEGSGRPVTLVAVTIRDCVSNAGGGGAISANGGSVFFDRLRVVNNSAPSQTSVASGSGGGVYLKTVDLATIHDSIFAANTAQSLGGAMCVDASAGGGKVEIKRSSFVNNEVRSGNGGAVFGKLCDITMDSCAMHRNSCSQYGGGLALYESTATAEMCNFTENESGTHGGGAYFYESLLCLPLQMALT